MHLDVIEPRRLPDGGKVALAIHGGAGAPAADADEHAVEHAAGLAAAIAAGERILVAGGTALDAVSAAVRVLEDDPLFNAGRGAALTAAGTVELDACVMDGRTHAAGSIIAARYAKAPILAARAVLERTPHVLIADPSRDLLEQWQVPTADPEYFVTERRLAQLQAGHSDPSTPTVPSAISEAPAEPPAASAAPGSHLHSSNRPNGPDTAPDYVVGHGTVGAVALDRNGNLAAATSTGGVTGQFIGRVGDSPIPGAGTYADNRSVAVSCTGIGEYFLTGVIAHDVAARVRFGARDLPTAVRESMAENLDAVGGHGGLIAVDPTGRMVLAFNTEAMFRAAIDWAPRQ